MVYLRCQGHTIEGWLCVQSSLETYVSSVPLCLKESGESEDGRIVWDGWEPNVLSNCRQNYLSPSKTGNITTVLILV